MVGCSELRSTVPASPRMRCCGPLRVGGVATSGDAFRRARSTLLATCKSPALESQPEHSRNLPILRLRSRRRIVISASTVWFAGHPPAEYIVMADREIPTRVAPESECQPGLDWAYSPRGTSPHSPQTALPSYTHIHIYPTNTILPVHRPHPSTHNESWTAPKKAKKSPRH